jgi:alpha-tubulin suppressor-like RCC1 family protein
VKAGGHTSYLLTSEGKVFSFGNGQYGTLGNGDSLEVDVPTLITHANLSGKKIVDIAVSSDGSADQIASSHALLLADDGTLFAMGSNAYGQLGVGDLLNRFVPTPITTNLSGKTITKIAVGGFNSMAIASDGSVFLWGNGGAGEMGFGNTNNLNVPTLAAHANVSGKKIIDGAVGYWYNLDSRAHFLVLSEDDTLYSFGENNDGQLGQGNKTDNYIPTQVLDTMLTGETIVGVQAGFHTSLLLTQSGKLFGWGQARKLGFNVSTLTDYIEPTLLESDDLDGRKVLAARAHANHSLALYDDGTVLSFGTYSLAQNAGVLGNGHTSGDGTNSGDYIGQKLPTKIAGFSTYETPLPATNLVLHLNAARLGYSTSNDSVTTWNNLTGSGFNAAQSELAIRPLLADSAINNHPALRFNGTNTYFSLPTSTNLGIQSSDYEVFIVAKSATSHSNTEFLMAGSVERYELHVNGAAGARFIPIGLTYIDNGSSGDYTDATAQLYNVRATSTQAVMCVNRKATVSSVNAQSSDAGTLYLGVRGNNSLFLNGDIAEVIIYDEVLSDNDRRAVESYLFKKYAIQNYKESSGQLTGTEGWRLLTSPVADSSFTPLLKPFWTQGFTGASVEHGTSNVYTWPTTATDTANTNWTTIANMSDSLHPGQGVLVYVFSDDDGPGVEGDAGFPKTFSMEGREPDSDQSLTARLNPNENGWALVGNPFRNDIDWDGFTRSGLSNAVYVYDHNASGWKSWNGTLGSLSGGGIGAFNAFFVQTLSENPTLEIPVSAKSDSAIKFLGKQRAKADPDYFSLELKSETGLTNKAWFQFSEGGKFGIDASDALQLTPLSNQYVTLASVINEESHLDINSLPEGEEIYEVPLSIENFGSGEEHQMSLEDLNLPDDWTVNLYDSELDISTDLEEAYTFTLDPAKAKPVNSRQMVTPTSIMDMAGMGKSKPTAPRFILTVTAAYTVGTEEVNNLPEVVELQQNYPNPFNPTTTIQFGVPKTSKVRLEVFDLLGRKVATLIDGESRAAGRYNVQFDARSLASGLYLYRLRAGDTVITKKLTLIK